MSQMYKYFIVFLIIIGSAVNAQESAWDKINGSNSELPNETIKCITLGQAGDLWIGTYMGGIAVIQDNIWTTYSTSNSELPHNYINSIAIDKNNIKWIGTDGGGLTSFDGTNWVTYKTSNSGLPSNVVMSVFCDDDGTVWAGTYFGGLAHFDGENWKIYNDENSPLLSNKVVSITKDNNGLLWIGTQGGGIASFDRNSWNVYTERNSKLPSDYIYSISIDQNNAKWIGTGGGGVSVFNDVFWITYNSENSNLTDDNIRPTVIDEFGNIWFGTYIGGLNKYDGNLWSVYDFQNSAMPDDEVTSLAYVNNSLYIGTERSGIIKFNDIQPPITPLQAEELAISAITNAQEKINPGNTNEVNSSKEFVSVTPKQNKIVLVIDAADINYDPKRLDKYIRSYSLLLNNRERVDDTYNIDLMIYSSNYDVSAKKIVLTEKQLKKLKVENVIYLDGESTFTDGIKKAYKHITSDYNPNGNNHVIAATYKFIRDDETAKVVIKDNLDNNYIVFSLLAFETKNWKLERKMRSMIPEGQGHYYSINPLSFTDNWAFTGSIGATVFAGDIDNGESIRFPGVFGLSATKKVFAGGIFSGGIKAQFNYGQMKGEKPNYSFTNKYLEGSLNFQLELNSWFTKKSHFKKLKPYGYVGVGFINFRSLLRNADGDIINGFGYLLDEENTDDIPEKDKAITNLIIPFAGGLSYRLSPKVNIELEAASRWLSTDKLDGKEKRSNDYYFIVSLGITYKLNTKQFINQTLKK